MAGQELAQLSGEKRIDPDQQDLRHPRSVTRSRLLPEARSSTPKRREPSPKRLLRDERPLLRNDEDLRSDTNVSEQPLGVGDVHADAAMGKRIAD